MFSQAMKHEKPTNVRLGNPSWDDTPCGTIAHVRHLKMPLKLPRAAPLQQPGGGPLLCALALDKVAQPPPVQPELRQLAKVVVVRLVPGKGTGTE